MRRIAKWLLLFPGALRDNSVGVRRETVMALAWCGSRGHLPALVQALGDHG